MALLGRRSSAAFAASTVLVDVRTGAEVDVADGQLGELGDTQSGLHSDQQQPSGVPVGRWAYARPAQIPPAAWSWPGRTRSLSLRVHPLRDGQGVPSQLPQRLVQQWRRSLQLDVVLASDHQPR